MTEATTQNRRLGILEMAGKTEGLAQDQLANVWKAGEDLEVGADWESLAGLGSFSAIAGGYSFWKLRQSLQAKAYFQNAYRTAITDTIAQLPEEIRARFTPKLQAQHQRLLELRRLETELAKPENTANNALKQQVKNLRSTITREINTIADDLIKEAGPLVGNMDASMVELIAQMEGAGIRIGRGSAAELLARLGSMSASEVPAGLKAPYERFRAAYDTRCTQFKANMEALAKTMSSENQAILAKYIQEMEAAHANGRIYEFPSEATLRSALGAEALGESAQKALAEIGQINGRMAQAGFAGFEEAMQAAMSTAGITDAEKAALNTILEEARAANTAGTFKVPAADAIRTMVAERLGVASNDVISVFGNKLQGDFFERIMIYTGAPEDYKKVIRSMAQEIRSGAAWPSNENITARLNTAGRTTLTNPMKHVLETNTKILSGALPAEQEQVLRNIATELQRHYAAASNEGKILEAYLKELKAGKPIPSVPEIARKLGIRSTTLSKEFTTALTAYTNAERAAAAKLPTLFEESVKPLMDVLGEAERNTLKQIIADVKSGKPLPTSAELTSRLNLRSATLTPEVERALTSFANVEKGSASAFEQAAVAFEDDAVRAAGNSRLGASVARLEETRALVRDVGSRRAARGLRSVLGAGEEGLAKALQEGAEATAAFNQARERVTRELVQNPGKFGRAANKVQSVLRSMSRRALPSAAGVACIMGIYAMIDNNTYDERKAEALADLATRMEQLNIRATNKTFTPEKRKQLVEWALKNTDDPQEKEMLQKLIACDYNFARYLSEHRGISFECSFAHDMTNEWANEVMNLCQEGFNASFYTQLETRQAASERTTDRSQTTAETTTQETGERPSSTQTGPEVGTPEQTGTEAGTPEQAGPEAGTSSTTTSTQTGPEAGTPETTSETPETQANGPRDPNKPIPLHEVKKPQDMSAQDYQDYANRGQVLLEKHRRGEQLTPEEQQEYNAIQSAFNAYRALHGLDQENGNSSGGSGNGGNGGAGNGGAGGAGNGGAGNTESTTTLPPEAIIQADQRGFWERNWDWIVAAAVAVAAAVGAFFLIKKQKKKTDEAKKEASTLQTQVTDLTNKVNELTEEKDGSTLANNSTQINTDTLGGNTGNGENTTIIVPSSKSME